MSKESVLAKIIHFLFSKLFKINDSPEKIALGVGLGVFAGLIPGTGPAAALFLAFIFRANRAAALFGGLLTNTWLSIVTFILAIKVGSVILKMNWKIVQEQAQELLRNFGWAALFKLSFLQVLLPVILGYLIIGLILGAFSYSLTWLIIRRNFYGNKTTHL
ncbi:MAG TPA: DUF2062 domain-containing protein [Candidatus Omnitrophota bacterium]|nr:DUF2062 domain-containing protein [Candidatus Omnitrophota bacterium]HPT39351.1 DUF2062 domain-containing protein [Candidatus Omnitrophota bacterium]